MGQPVPDGDYAFVVNQVNCGVGTVAGEVDTGTPVQGRFCIAVVTMTNTTRVPQDVPPEGTMTDTNGNIYNTTSDVSAKVAAQEVYLGPHFTSELQVNPGSHYTDVYVYDVPTGVRATMLTLLGGVGSTGVRVAVTAGQAQPGAPAQTGGAATPTTSSSAPGAPPTSAAANSPQAVVEQYFAAINAGDYGRAWSLGGKNIASGSYDAFVQGFSGTSHDAATVVSVNGDVVSVELDATQTDGTHKFFSGTYTVSNGVIVAADIH